MVLKNFFEYLNFELWLLLPCARLNLCLVLGYLVFEILCVVLSYEYFGHLFGNGVRPHFYIVNYLADNFSQNVDVSR